MGYLSLTSGAEAERWVTINDLTLIQKIATLLFLILILGFLVAGLMLVINLLRLVLSLILKNNNLRASAIKWIKVFIIILLILLGAWMVCRLLDAYVFETLVFVEHPTYSRNF